MANERESRPLRWRGPVSMPADRITASMRVRAVRIAALEAQLAADHKMLRDLRALLPFAAKKLPPEVLECFDEQQRMISPYPQPWLIKRPRPRPAGAVPPQIPMQRRPMPGRHARPEPPRSDT